MTKPALVIRQAISQFLILSIYILVVPLFVAVDALYLADGVSETSVTEVAQEVLLSVAALLFGSYAWRRPRARGFLILVAGFFSCMLIRELDGFFDFIYPGFWVWPAAGVAVGSIAFARNHPGTFVVPMAVYLRSNSYTFLLVGMLVLVLSRTFGSGNLLWDSIMGTSYTPLFKAALQEGLELFGYIFISYGSWRAKSVVYEVATNQNKSFANDEPRPIVLPS